MRSAAARLRVLEGQVVAAETPHPRAEVLGIAPRIDGRRLDRVEAVGKNLLFTFDDGTVLRSHLRMRGRWHVRPAGAPRRGTPWLVLRGTSRRRSSGTDLSSSSAVARSIGLGRTSWTTLPTSTRSSSASVAPTSGPSSPTSSSINASWRESGTCGARRAFSSRACLHGVGSPTSPTRSFVMFSPTSRMR